jgi:hypothetical protein
VCAASTGTLMITGYDARASGGAIIFVRAKLTAKTGVSSVIPDFTIRTLGTTSNAAHLIETSAVTLGGGAVTLSATPPMLPLTMARLIEETLMGCVGEFAWLDFKISPSAMVTFKELDEIIINITNMEFIDADLQVQIWEDATPIVNRVPCDTIVFTPGGLSITITMPI